MTPTPVLVPSLQNNWWYDKYGHINVGCHIKSLCRKVLYILIPLFLPGHPWRLVIIWFFWGVKRARGVVLDQGDLCVDSPPLEVWYRLIMNYNFAFVCCWIFPVIWWPPVALTMATVWILVICTLKPLPNPLLRRLICQRNCYSVDHYGGGKWLCLIFVLILFGSPIFCNFNVYKSFCSYAFNWYT